MKSIASVLILGMISITAAHGAEARWTVGVAKLDITPDHPVRLTGYGNRRAEATEAAQRIWAKALVLDDGEHGPAVWIAFENCGVTPTIRDEVVRQLHESHNLPPERIVISVTHSHTAPALTNWAPYIFGEDLPPEHQEHVDRYTRELTANLVRVARDAVVARQPASLYWGQGKVGFAVNRRVLKEGKWTGFGEQLDGPVDHSLPLLIARDVDGKLLACVANYACHCTTLGGNFNQICGDWAGYAAEFIEADQPGCVAMITIGCGADANPHPRRDDLEVCREQGRELSKEVARLLQSTLKPLPPQLRCRALQIDLPFAPPLSRDEWQARAQAKDATGYHARQFLARIDRGETLPTALPYPLASWCFGRDLAMVFLGGEVVVDYSLRLKTEFDAERLWLTAYSNDVCCYIPSRRILAEGGYEADRSMVYYARPQQFSGDVEDLIVDAVQKLLPQWFYSPGKQAEFPPPRSPEETLQSIRVKPGFKVELVAAEPLVEDPVAFDWSPDGRLWVAEMRDYPNGMAWDKPGDPLGVPGGRIKLLSDTNGDGRYDKATVFLDNIPFPNGVKSWRQGVLVSAAPTVFYAEDTDNDGVADKRDTLFEGFAQGNQQHRANGLRWGFDNWLYMANGDSGGKVKSLKTGEEVSISGRDLRIRPDTGEVEAQSGQTQFGRCCDDWGNWFGGNNSNPLWHYVLDDHYLRRNPNYSPPAVRRDVPEARGASPVFPTSRTLARFNDFYAVNRFTSACSPEVYRDQQLFGEATAASGELSHVFICEPVHNLVHHEVMMREGVSFRSRRADDEQDSEFFASEDNWCRPVMVRTGPDGALWIADMYRQVIEHPEWIPLTWQRKLELRAGTERGRIYRVSRADDAEISDWSELGLLDTPGLIAVLSRTNGWQRDMAQQLLIQRNDQLAIPLLQEVAAQFVRPESRLQALATLAGMNGLTQDVLQVALKDRHPGVRRYAVRLAEESSLDVWNQIATLVNDDDPLVRQQVAYSLGSWKSGDAVTGNPTGKLNPGSLLAKIALRDRAEPAIVAAVMSSVSERNGQFVISELLSPQPPASELAQQVLQVLGKSVGSASYEEAVLKLLSHAALQVEKSSTAESADQSFRNAANVLALLRRIKNVNGTYFPGIQRTIGEIVSAAQKTAADVQADPQVRVSAVHVLGAQPKTPGELAQVLRSLLAPQNPPELQAAAVDGLVARFPDNAVEHMLAGWPSHAPALRGHILDQLLTRRGWIEPLMDAMETGQVPASDLDARRRQQLLGHADELIRTRASKLFGNDSPSSRHQVVAQLQTASTIAGDAARGKQLFGKKCAPCHRLEGVGNHVGPELTSLTDKSPPSLLTAMLDPNKAVESKFLDYVAVTTEGRQFTGMIASETSTSVTLVGQDGKQVVLLRNELDVLQSTGKSLMPEGLEKEMTVQDFADTIAYVRGVSAPPKQFPGNQPALAHVRDDGSIRLLAMNARIYGTSLVFEEKYRNLGFWQHPDDHAIWVMNVPKAGTYRVSLDYACDDAAAGDRFVIVTGDQLLGGVVEGTGSWDSYRSRSIGTLTLPAGQVELLMRSDGPIRSALIDLRQIVLHPR